MSGDTDHAMEMGTARVADSEAVWKDLLDEHGPALARVAATYERDPVLQEDLYQEICLALWKAMSTFRGDASLRTFAFRVAHNRGLSHGWRQARRGTEALDTAGPLISAAPGPEAVAAGRERHARLQDAVRSLPLGQRQVIALSLEGLPQSEIADILGITENNVAVRLHRARRALERRLADRETPR